MALIFPSFGETSGGVFESVGDDPFAAFPTPAISNTITGGTPGFSILPTRASPAASVSDVSGGSGLSAILQRGFGAIADAGLQSVARSITGGDSRTETVILKRREARRKRRAEQTFGVNTKSLGVAVVVGLVALVGLSLLFRK